MASDKRNVVLVTTDSLRADHCNFMGYKKEITPTLDQIAKEGLCFKNAYSPGPSTLDAMPVIFTGEFPIKRSTELNEKPIQETLREHMLARETVAEKFSRMGYHTAGFSANPWTSRYLEFDQGFDHFEDFMETDRSNNRIEKQLSNGSFDSTFITHILNWKDEQNMFQSWMAFYDKIIEVVDDLEEPYFLWIFLVDTHMPYLTKKKYRSQSKVMSYLSNLYMYSKSDRLEPFVRERLIRAYDDSIKQMDAFIDKILNDTADDDPLFIFHSDHGEGFGERDFYGHGENIYEEQVHVPLLIANGPKGTVNKPFSLRSLPDLLTKLAVEESYQDLIKTSINYRNQEKLAVQGENWKYINNTDEDENELLIFDGDCWKFLPSTQMETVAQQFVNDWRQTLTEQREIADSARKLAETGPI